MERFAAFIMRGPLNAGAVAVVTLLASIVLPPLAWLSAAVVALVTLRLGPAAILRVMIPAIVGIALAGAVILGQGAAVALAALASWLPAMMLGVVLRQRVRLDDTLLAACAMGWLIVGALELLIADPASWWTARLTAVMPPAELSAQLGISEAAVRDLIARVAPLAGGIVAAAVVLSAITSLLLARWWQALLYNPGGFGDEFRSLRLGRTAAAVALALGVLALTTSTLIVAELAMVAFTVYVFQGLAVIHGAAAIRGIHPAWLIGVYAALVLLTSIALGALLLLGMADAWTDIRRRIEPGNGG